MIYIFDLDYTLLDTIKFKEGLAKVHGLSQPEFQKAYKKICQSYGLDPKSKNKPYNIKKFIELLVAEGKYGISETETREKDILNFVKTIDDYLFPNVEKILQECRKKTDNIILMSYGDDDWHKLKIDNLKIKKYFSEVIITTDDKNKLLDKLNNFDDKIIIINDNARECKIMQEALKNSEIFLVKGPYSDNIKHNFEIKKLENLIKK